MATGEFVTAINCIDGRVHIPVINWLKASFEAEFVDHITEPGADKALAGTGYRSVGKLRVAGGGGFPN